MNFSKITAIIRPDKQEAVEIELLKPRVSCASVEIAEAITHVALLIMKVMVVLQYHQLKIFIKFAAKKNVNMTPANKPVIFQ